MFFLFALQHHFFDNLNPFISKKNYHRTPHSIALTAANKYSRG